MEPLIEQPLDQHTSRAIAPAPDNDRGIAGVAEMQACSACGRSLSAAMIAGAPRTVPILATSCRGSRHAGLQESPTRCRNRFTHSTLLKALLAQAATDKPIANSRYGAATL